MQKRRLLRGALYRKEFQNKKQSEEEEEESEEEGSSEYESSSEEEQEDTLARLPKPVFIPK